MKYVWFIPSIIYAMLIFLAGAIYLAEGYLVQIKTLQVLYSVGALGLLSQSFLLMGLVQNEWSIRIIRILDLLLISAAIYLVTSGYSLLFFLVLLYIFYIGLVANHWWLDLISGYFVFFNLVVQYIFLEQVTLPDILIQLLFSGSVLVVNLLSRSIAESISEEQKKNVFLQQLNQAILSNVPYGFLVTKVEDGNVVHFNPYLKTIFAKIRPNIQIDQFLTPFEVFPELKTLDASDRFGLDIIRKVADGFLFLRTKLIKLMDITQNMYLYIFEDRTEIEKLEMSRRQSEKLAAIGTLAAGIAHEIRNPLAGISGALQLLEPNIATDESKRLVRIVFREIDRLNHLVTEFLDYARSESNPPTTPVNLKAVLMDCFLVVSSDTRFPFVKNLAPPSLEDCYILGHSEKLKQVFLNIMVNALESMVQSPVQNLKIMLTKEANLIKVVIEDTGEGMAQETIQRVFEPFYTTKDKGTGLGMAIVLKIIENHRGRIFLESAKGKGTRVEIHFPPAIS